MEREYKFFIPYVNRQDFLDRAIKCVIPTVKNNLIVIDNSDDQNLHPGKYGNWEQDGEIYFIEVIKPTYPLLFSQTMNLMQNIAIQKDLAFFIFMHNDAVAPQERIDKLFKMVDESFKKEPAWAVIFTLYDLLCAYRTSAIEDIGKWDVTFPQYFADNDYFRRVKLKGYKCLESGGEGMGHDTSATVRNDPARWWANEKSFMLYKELYKSKWGGYQDEEIYDCPYNKLPL